MFPLKQAGLEENPASFRDDTAALMLNERGMIRDCSKSLEELVGYTRSELVWRHVSMLLPQLEESAMIRGGRLNPRIGYLCHCGQLFQVRNRDGHSFQSEIRLFELENSGRRTLRLIVCRQIEGRG